LALNCPYWINVEYSIHDKEKLNQFWQLAPAAKEFGARLRVRQGHPPILQGEPHRVIAVFELESVEAVKRWYESPEYQTAVGLWVDSVDSWAMIAGEVLDLESLNPLAFNNPSRGV
jgi:uncharacterized protein (DUF1330 family)